MSRANLIRSGTMSRDSYFLLGETYLIRRNDLHRSDIVCVCCCYRCRWRKHWKESNPAAVSVIPYRFRYLDIDDKQPPLKDTATTSLSSFLLGEPCILALVCVRMWAWVWRMRDVRGLALPIGLRLVWLDWQRLRCVVGDHNAESFDAHSHEYDARIFTSSPCSFSRVSKRGGIIRHQCFLLEILLGWIAYLFALGEEGGDLFFTGIDW